DLGRVAGAIQKTLAHTKLPEGIRVNLRGMVEAMHSSFVSFGLGLCLAILLLYLFLVPAFKSFKDPFLVLLAVPPGLAGVLWTLTVTGTTLNVMTLMGVVMLFGIAVSNSILIVEYANRMEEAKMALAIIGGLTVSFVATLYVVPAAYVWMRAGRRAGAVTE